MVENPAITELLAIFKRFVNIDEDVENKTLFLKIAKDILLGKKATDIAKKYTVEELAIVGVRRRLDEYKNRAQNRTLNETINRLLRKTKWLDTFTPEWTSPELHEMIISRGNLPPKNKVGKGTHELKVKAKFKTALARKPI